MANGRDKSSRLTVFWKVENITCCNTIAHMHKSPSITSNIKDTKWTLFFACIPCRNQYCIFPEGGINFFIRKDSGEDVNVDVRLSLLSTEGILIEREEFTNWNTKEGILSFDKNVKMRTPVINVQIDIWEKRSKGHESEVVLIRSQFGEEEFSFLWPIKGFTSLQPGEKREIQPSERRSLYLSAFIDTQGSFSISLNRNQRPNLENEFLTTTISVIDADNRKIESVKPEKISFSWFSLLEERVIRFPTLKQKSVGKPYLYLPEGVLSLRCDFHFERVLKHKPLIYIKGAATDPELTFFSTNIPLYLNIDKKKQGETVKNSKRESLIVDLQKMYLEEKLTDFIIRTPLKSFQVHKGILATRSSVFEAMLTGDMKEARDNSMQVLDVEEDTMHRFLLFLYTNELEDGLCWEDVAKLYYVANKYQVPSLKQRCSLLLKTGLSLENACKALVLADIHADDTDFDSAVNEFFFQHYREVISSEKWDKLQLENSKLAAKVMRELLKSNEGIVQKYCSKINIT